MCRRHTTLVAINIIIAVIVVAVIVYVAAVVAVVVVNLAVAVVAFYPSGKLRIFVALRFILAMHDDSDDDGDNTELVAVPDAVIMRGVRTATTIFV